MLSWIGFSPDGKRFAFTQQRDNGIELWIGDSATGQAKSITTAQLNATLGTPCEWVGDGGSLLCEFVSPNRGAAPTMGVPTGPNIQEHRGGIAPVRTYQDLLASAHDEALFDYYAHQPARVRGRDQRSAHRRRHARGVRDGGAVARWSVHPRPPRAASVFVARAVPEFPGEHRGVGSPGRAR